MAKRKLKKEVGKTIIGIDGGHKGGIAVTFRNSETEAYPMPILKLPKGRKGTKTVYDKKAIVDLFSKVIEQSMGSNNILVMLEQAQAFPGQGGVSNFSTGYAYGFMEGVLTALELPYELVHPRTWQKEMFKGKAIPKSVNKTDRKKAIKNISYEVSSKLFPGIELRGPQGGLRDGLCDALLIMEYGHRIQNK